MLNQMNTEEELVHISREVLGEETAVDPGLYRNRLALLYTVIVEDAAQAGGESALQERIGQICAFERSQLYLTEVTQGQYRSLTPRVAVHCFSEAAFGLAAERLKGREYGELAELLCTVFAALTDTVGTGSSPMEISEGLLDFRFAAGASQDMSLRLKRHWDAAGREPVQEAVEKVPGETTAEETRDASADAAGVDR